MARYRGYVLTIPYVYNKERVKFKYVVNSLIKYSYFVFQLERGVETGYKHFQLYLENDNPISFSTIKNIFPYAHIECREGTKQQAFEYCTKEETRLHGYWEFGERPNFEESVETPRSKKEKMMNDVLDGKPDKYLMITYPTIFSKKLVNEWRSVAGINLYQNNRNVICTYIFGSTGIGKSSYVRRKYSADQIYVVSDYERAPFDNYNGQKIIVFEEYRSNFPLSLFLQYLDIYPLLLPARYSNKQALYDRVYIISNWSLDQQYYNCSNADKFALYRRIKYSITITKDYCVRQVYSGGIYTGNEWVYNPLGSVYKGLSDGCPIDLPTYFEED